jgi:hypothetical protein
LYLFVVEAKSFLFCSVDKQPKLFQVFTMARTFSAIIVAIFCAAATAFVNNGEAMHQKVCMSHI